MHYLRMISTRDLNAVTFVILSNNSILTNSARLNEWRMFGWNVHHTRKVTCKALEGIVSNHLVFDFNKSSFDTWSKLNERTNRIAFMLWVKLLYYRSRVIMNISNENETI